jgi:capsular polysaccharide transport system permease protein
MKKIKQLKKKAILFFTIFLVGMIYIFFIKSELYEAKTQVVIKDLNGNKASLSGLPFLMPTSSDTQSIYAIQTYLTSFDELKNIDKLFHLQKHYKSTNIDIVQRLKNWATKEDLLYLYNKRLTIIFDPVTNILNISFLHTNPQISYKIVQQLVVDADSKINEYNKLIAQKQLMSIAKQVTENQMVLKKSIKDLEQFQNKYTLLDPSQTAQAQLSLIASLEGQLLQKQAKLNELSQYMNKNNFEIVRLKNDITESTKTLNKMKKTLASKDKKSLNLYIFEFERLKSMMELNKELYKQSLLQMEQIKTEINKNSKMLLVLTKPFVPQGYKYPEKFKDVITLLLILLLLYGIISLIEAIIKEHID